MRNCVFVVFIPLSTLGVIALGLLFKHVDRLRAQLDTLWTPILVVLAIGSLLFSHFLVKKRTKQYANTPQAASPYDTEKDRAMARIAYFTALLVSVGLVMFIFVA